MTLEELVEINWKEYEYMWHVEVEKAGKKFAYRTGFINGYYLKNNESNTKLKEAINVIALLRSIVLDMDNKYLEDHETLIDASKDFIDSLKRIYNEK